VDYLYRRLVIAIGLYQSHQSTELIVKTWGLYMLLMLLTSKQQWAFFSYYDVGIVKGQWKRISLNWTWTGINSTIFCCFSTGLRKIPNEYYIVCYLKTDQINEKCLCFFENFVFRPKIFLFGHTRWETFSKINDEKTPNLWMCIFYFKHKKRPRQNLEYCCFEAEILHIKYAKLFYGLKLKFYT
jgi:hypothetical protein